MTWGTAVLAGVMGFAFLGPAVARADDGADRSACYESDQYDACFREGKRLFAEERFDEAYRAYLRGFELKPNFQAAGNLGNVELKLGMYGPAYQHLKYSHENLGPSERGTPVEKTLEDKIAQALEHIGGRKLSIRPDTAALEVDGSPVDLTTSPWLGLAPGNHTIRITAAGHLALEETIHVRTGTEETLSFSLAIDQDHRAPSSPPQTDDGVRLALGVAALTVGAGALAGTVVLGVFAADRGQAVEELSASARTLAPNGYSCGAGSPALETDICARLERDAEEQLLFRGSAIGLGVASALLVAAGITVLALPSDDDDVALDVETTSSSAEVRLRGRF